MTRTLLSIALVGAGILTPPAQAQVQGFKPVTAAELANPSPNDWLSFSRTYDDQRFSPLNQINRQNVGQLRMAWTRGTPAWSHRNGRSLTLSSGTWGKYFRRIKSP